MKTKYSHRTPGSLKEMVKFKHKCFFCPDSVRIIFRMFPIMAMFLVSLAVQIHGQTITGKIFNASGGTPLEYVSIGVVNTTAGTITNEEGVFKLEVKGHQPQETVRFSMIGFKSQTFTIGELSNRENIIRLIDEPYLLKEVVVRPSGIFRDVGVNSYTWHGGLCGWGGTDFGKGHEIGTKLDLGTIPVALKRLHIRIANQSFDSSLFRLHIRDISGDLPDHELLTKNIFICITKESGWFDTDLGKYNLVFKGEIALSLEWIKVIGLNKEKLMKMNGSKVYSPTVLFTIKRNQGCIYTKWGIESKWNRSDNESPSIYLTIEK